MTFLIRIILSIRILLNHLFSENFLGIWWEPPSNINSREKKMKKFNRTGGYLSCVNFIPY